MALLHFLVLVLGVTYVCACGRSSGSEPDCSSYDCPSFTVMEIAEGYELRKYEAAKWVSTVMSETDENRGGFGRLFDYISGNNAEGQKIDMTAPVATKMEGDTKTMSFYIPFDHQDNPPTPNDASVFVHEVPEHEVYVRSFSGYASQSDYETHAEALATALQQAGMSWREGIWFTAGYDAPFKPINRRNEVWYMKA